MRKLGIWPSLISEIIKSWTQATTRHGTSQSLKLERKQILEEPEHVELFQTHLTTMWEVAHRHAQEVEVCQEHQEEGEAGTRFKQVVRSREANLPLLFRISPETAPNPPFSFTSLLLGKRLTTANFLTLSIV